ncbi:MAG TPA: glycine cleavage system protein H, partial [Candidatus Deferrimicrobiaceae bacterium]
FLTGFIYFSRYLSHRAPAPEVAEGRPRSFVEYFRVPDGYLFHQGHSWLKAEDDRLVKVGMDDFSQKLIGKVDAVRLPGPGAKLQQGEKGWAVSAQDKTIDILSPIDGEVVAVNQEAIRNPDLLGLDPFESGWLLKVRPERFNPNKRNLLSGEMARQWMSSVLERLRGDIGNSMEQEGPALGTVYQDGGRPVRGIARALAGDRWEELARGYFHTDGRE